MIDLHRFLANPFDDKEVSMDELLAFTTDHGKTCGIGTMCWSG